MVRNQTGWEIKMAWGAYVQHGNLEDVERLGAELSIRLHCPIHYPAYNKNLFECKCGVIFPLYVVKGQDWESITQRHSKEKELVRS